MPIRHGGMLASRASVWPRDHFCHVVALDQRGAVVPWNESLPTSMPIVATVRLDFLDVAVLRLTLAPFEHHSLARQEHGQTVSISCLPAK
jgi:hypothetical protein